MDEQSELRLELKRDFTEFLDQDFGRETGEGRYVRKVDDIAKQYPQTKRVRLEVDLQGEQDRGQPPLRIDSQAGSLPLHPTPMSEYGLMPHRPVGLQ